VTREPIAATIGDILDLSNTPQDLPLLTATRSQTLLMAATIAGGVLSASQAAAQWWWRGPVDFEDCADLAEKINAKDAKAAALSECNAKFAGRRKPGGGYTYFDFMQNRNFDIAGPNPTAEEQRQIDEQYTIYLENQRRKSIKAAFLAKQQQMQQASLKQDAEKMDVATASIGKPQAAPGAARRIRSAACPRPSFSCDWPRLSEGINDLKKLFGSSPGKAGRS
jgi:hypothetical protein